MGLALRNVKISQYTALINGNVQFLLTLHVAVWSSAVRRTISLLISHVGLLTRQTLEPPRPETRLFETPYASIAVSV